MTLLPPEDMASASYNQKTATYTVTDSSGQRFQMTEDSFEDFISKMGVTIDDLGLFRDKVLQGSVVSVREGWNQEYLSMAAFEDVDAVNLKLGGFDDAIELQQAYKTVYYPSRAEQLDRVYHGLDTGRVISEDIKTSYLESDGDITADVTSVQSEFDSRGGNISAGDVDEARADNKQDSGEPASDSEPGSDDGPREL